MLVICTGFLFLFTAFQSLQALQTSLFIGSDIGPYSLAVIYGGLVLSSFFIPTPLVKVLGENGKRELLVIRHIEIMDVLMAVCGPSEI